MSRKKYTSKFKFKVVLEALKERQTLTQLAQKYSIHPQLISNWKRDFLEQGFEVFDKKKSKQTEAEQEKDQLLKTIGKLKVENDFLSKALR